MIHYLKHNEIDKKKWDSCIAQSFNGIIYAYSWYLDIVCPGWEALVEEDHRRVMPLTARSKFGIRYLYQPFFTQQLGVFSVDKMSGKDVQRFIDAVPSQFKLIEISLNTFNQLESADNNIELKRSLTHELDLISSYEVLHAQYSENTKRNVKKAIKNELSVMKYVSARQVIDLFSNNKGKEAGEFTESHYEMLTQLIDECVKRGQGHVWGVSNKQGKICAGAFFIESNGKVIFLFSGRNDEAKTNGAMFFLIDRFIAANSQRNLILDFEGSNDPDLARFYKGFGSKECVYLQVRKNNLPALIRWLKKAK